MTNCIKLDKCDTEPKEPLNALKAQSYNQDSLLPVTPLKKSKQCRFLQKAVSVGFTGEECEALIALYGKHL